MAPITKETIIYRKIPAQICQYTALPLKYANYYIEHILHRLGDDAANWPKEQHISFALFHCICLKLAKEQPITRFTRAKMKIISVLDRAKVAVSDFSMNSESLGKLRIGMRKFVDRIKSALKKSE